MRSTIYPNWDSTQHLKAKKYLEAKKRKNLEQQASKERKIEYTLIKENILS
jgi:hypothetical protein